MWENVLNFRLMDLSAEIIGCTLELLQPHMQGPLGKSAFPILIYTYKGAAREICRVLQISFIVFVLS